MSKLLKKIGLNSRKALNSSISPKKKNKVLKEIKFSEDLENAKTLLLELKSNEYDFAAQLVEGVNREDALYLLPDYKSELTSNSCSPCGWTPA